uniref:DUF3908 family protein n=1 Tax=Bacillus pseudomycoides TaxID=64104 RepID=UPI0037042D47
YENIRDISLKRNDKNRTLELKLCNGNCIMVDSLNDKCGRKNWLFGREIKSMFKVI